MKAMNPMDERNNRECERMRCIKEGVHVPLEGTLTPETQRKLIGVYLEQGAPGQDSWELILSQEQSQFAVLFLDNRAVKMLADFFGQMARVGAKFVKEKA